MSAIPPKADIAERVGMSALCQKRTYVAQENAVDLSDGADCSSANNVALALGGFGSFRHGSFRRGFGAVGPKLAKFALPNPERRGSNK
jgi:hypothetical protein